jgi:hypothetical protein
LPGLYSRLLRLTSGAKVADRLADDPALADVKAALRRRLEAWMAQQGDKGIRTEMQALGRMGLLRRLTGSAPADEN